MKATLNFLLLFSFFTNAQILQAQCSVESCPPGPPPLALCAEDACISCLLSNLDGYEGMTVTGFNACDLPGPFCGSIENNQWFGFVAPLETVTFNFEVFNCVGQSNGSGIQAEVYSTTNCNNFTSVSDCWNPGIETSGSVTAQDLIIGDTYYLMIDGWANDFCDFIITVDSASLSNSGNPSHSFSGPVTNCPNTSSQYVANVGCVTNLTWTFEGNGNLATDPDSTVATIEWGDPAEGTLCLSVTFVDGTIGETCLEMGELSLEPTTLTTTPPPSFPGTTEFCLGDVFSVEAENPFIGSINDSLLNFEWSFGDGNFRKGINQYHNYQLPGEYEIKLFVHLDGCDMRDTLSHIVRVIPLPSANISGAPLEGICPETEINLIGENTTEDLVVQPLLFERQNYQTPLSLPDGVGDSVITDFQISGTDPGEVLTSVENFKICVTMEHSWMRDLEIKLTCPSGQSVILHDHVGQTGSEVFLGIPIENDEGLPEPIPGTGYPYCWTVNATNGTWLETANSTGAGTLPSGDYSSFEPLENLLGCPIDGDWTLTMADLWAIDNGHLFSATITIDNPSPDIIPLTNTAEWLPDPSIVFSDEYNMTAVPEFSTNYAYSVTNNMGCSTVITAPIEVVNNSPYCYPCDDLWVSIINDITITCENPFPVSIVTSTPYPNDSLDFTWTQNGSLVSNDYYLLVEEMAEYIVTVEYPLLGCSASDTLMFSENTVPPIANAGPDISLSNCPNPTTMLDGTASSIGSSFGYVWENSFGNFVSSIINPTIDAPGIYTLIVTDFDNGCTSSDTVEVFQGPLVSVLIESTPDSCGLSIGTATATLTPPQSNTNYMWSNGSTDATAIGLPYGPHSVSVQWSNCPELAYNFLVDSVECTTSPITEISGLESAQIFPNPTEGTATLSMSLKKNTTLELSIIDVLGRMLVPISAPQNFPAGEHNVDLNLRGLPSGVYYVSIRSGEHFEALRIVKY